MLFLYKPTLFGVDLFLATTSAPLFDNVLGIIEKKAQCAFATDKKNFISPFNRNLKAANPSSNSLFVIKNRGTPS